MNDKVEIMNRSGDRLFLNPSTPFCYTEIIEKGLSTNTYRGFHKMQNAKYGASLVFKTVFLNNESKIVNSLKSVDNPEGINSLAESLRREIQSGLKLVIKDSQLNSFNKIRKPIDILLEHLTALYQNFTEDDRLRILPYLFLPLDSQIFQSCFIFNDEDIDQLKIRRVFTFKDIHTEDQYFEIQNFVTSKARKYSLRYPIYFDLIWGKRYLNSGSNILESNPIV